MKIVISGASGLIGVPLVTALRAANHEVITLVRRSTSDPHEVQWDPAAGLLPPTALAGADAVINLAGAGIADKRWTPTYKKLVLDSRVTSTTLLARAIATMDPKPTVFLSGSAIGFYGDTGARSVDETAQRGQGFLAEVCVEWEAATAPAAAAGVRTVLLRTGLVMASSGGLLAKQLLPAKLGLGGRLGSGEQYQSWITLDDEVAAIVYLLSADVSGPVNLSAPNAVTQKEFAKTLGKVLHKPAVSWIPGQAIKLALGDFASEGVLVGQRVLPGKLLGAGFPFSSLTLTEGLHAVLG